MSVGVDRITEISLKSCPDYLPHVRRVISCLADGAGMDRQEAEDTTLVLNEACANAIRHGSRCSEDHVSITLKCSPCAIVADVRDCARGGSVSGDFDEQGAGLGVRLMRMLADSVEFIRDTAGLTVRLTKRAKRSHATRGIRVKRPTNSYRN